LILSSAEELQKNGMEKIIFSILLNYQMVMGVYWQKEKEKHTKIKIFLIVR
jgi:hypothetical protein